MNGFDDFGVDERGLGHDALHADLYGGGGQNHGQSERHSGAGKWEANERA